MPEQGPFSISLFELSQLKLSHDLNQVAYFRLVFCLVLSVTWS